MHTIKWYKALTDTLKTHAHESEYKTKPTTNTHRHIPLHGTQLNSDNPKVFVPKSTVENAK